MKKLGIKLLRYFIFALLMVAPIGATIWLSIEEQKEYAPAPEIKMPKLSYGELYTPIRQDIYEVVSVSAKVVSNQIHFIEIGAYADYTKLRMVVSAGDYINVGDLIAYYGEKQVFADKEGIIREISPGENGYIKLESTTKLALAASCSTNAELLKLTAEGAVLTDDKGLEYSILSVNDFVNEEGKRIVYLSLPEEADYMFGEVIENLEIRTGKVYTDVLTIEKDCVYSYAGSDHYYVRILDESGNFYEKEVTIGLVMGDYICISGIEEGVQCDSGYKMIVESNANE